MVDKKAVHFGAGNIGRGLIGSLLVQSGYHVIFADVDKALIDDINKFGKFDMYILEGDTPRCVEVSGISGVVAPDDVVKAITDPQVNIVTTSVGVRILPKIAGLVARGIQERRKAGCGPLNVIACENTLYATAQLEKAVDGHLSDEDREYVKQNVGFANCSVDRIVPPFEKKKPLDVGVEGFYEWIVERGSLKGVNEDGTLGIEGMLLADDLEPYVERKLFTLNTGHAITAYLGFIHGHETIDQSIRQELIRENVLGAMHESGAALRKKHASLREDEHALYILKLEGRFQNVNIRDDVKRVGREPLRKLSQGDRLLGPARMAKEHGLPIHHLSRGIAAAFLFDPEVDEQAVELQKMIHEAGIEQTVVEVTGFPKGTEEHAKVLEAYHELVEKKTSSKS